eukprot:jgi/Tetstr1/466754/TSEL_011224.t1
MLLVAGARTAAGRSGTASLGRTDRDETRCCSRAPPPNSRRDAGPRKPPPTIARVVGRKLLSSGWRSDTRARFRTRLTTFAATGDVGGELGSVSQRLAEVQQLRAQAANLRLRLERDAMAAVVAGDEGAARKAIVRKFEAEGLISDFDKRIAELNALKATLQRDPVLDDIRRAMEEEDSGGMLLLSQGSLESAQGAEDLAPAAFLSEFAQALASLSVTQRMDALSWIDLLSSLRRIAGEKQQEWVEWEAAALEAVAFGVGGGGVPEAQRAEAHWAVQLLEAAYQGAAMLEYFCTEQQDELGRPPLRMLHHRRVTEIGQPAYCVLWCADTRALVIGVRGLDSLKDTVTAATATPEPLLDGFCHQGALRGATWLQTQVEKYIREMRPATVQVLGHSLGGAVAAALAVKLHSAASAELPPPGREGPARSPGGGLSEALGLVGEDAANAPPSVSAITFGAPPCFCNGTHLQAAATELVETYIHGNDVVAWLSEGNISSLMIRADRSWRHARGFNQMLLPGRVFYIRRLQGAAYVAQRWEATNFLGSIPLAPDCIRDHRLFSYEKALAEPFVPS